MNEGATWFMIFIDCDRLILQQQIKQYESELRKNVNSSQNHSKLHRESYSNENNVRRLYRWNMYEVTFSKKNPYHRIINFERKTVAFL